MALPGNSVNGVMPAAFESLPNSAKQERGIVALRRLLPCRQQLAGRGKTLGRLLVQRSPAAAIATGRASFAAGGSNAMPAVAQRMATQ